MAISPDSIRLHMCMSHCMPGSFLSPPWDLSGRFCRLAMGNCTVRGTAVGCSVRGTAVGCSGHRATAVVAHVRVVVGNTGRVIEFQGPVPAGDVLVGFPRHGIFQQGDLSSPLLRHEQLQNGRLYYLLPLERKRARVQLPDTNGSASSSTETSTDLPFSSGMVCEHVRSLEVLPPQMNGVWRVKLAINAERLAGILSEQVDAEALIERMRMLAITVETMPKLQVRSGGVGGAAGWKAGPGGGGPSNGTSTL